MPPTFSIHYIWSTFWEGLPTWPPTHGTKTALQAVAGFAFALCMGRLLGSLASLFMKRRGRESSPSGALRCLLGGKAAAVADKENKAAEAKREAAAVAFGEEREDIPSEFCCPISQELMADPVSPLCGHTFEREIIEEWLLENPSCPVCREKPGTTQHLRPNFALKSLIETYVKKRPLLRGTSQEYEEEALQPPVIEGERKRSTRLAEKEAKRKEIRKKRQQRATDEENLKSKEAEDEIQRCVLKAASLIDEKNYGLAVPYLEKAIAVGHANAMALLGVMYCEGKGVDKDTFEGMRLIYRSAEKGDALGQFKLGVAYQHGLYGVTQDGKRAISWYRQAADKSGTYAGKAATNIGQCFFNGTGVARDYQQALSWFLKCRDKSKYGEDIAARAANNICHLYCHGHGVAKDMKKRVEWLRKGAEAGDMCAQCDLGYCYRYGQGVEQDTSLAIAWYRKSAAQGYQLAIGNLRNYGIHY